ncbi:hypothetical protein MK280_04555, partial [Myxococcota bacterium]|nr:hypothetical protein [Myxococcota bacterium]
TADGNGNFRPNFIALIRLVHLDLRSHSQFFVYGGRPLEKISRRPRTTLRSRIAASRNHWILDQGGIIRYQRNIPEEVPPLQQSVSEDSATGPGPAACGLQTRPT